jgi:glycerophosphoryl diester phosphodiesterase
MWIILFIVVIVLPLLYLLAIMPKMIGRHNFSSWQGRYYAHRGLHQDPNKVPENSMTAFQLAVENNYGIEMDIQLTKDKIPVVFHDFTLKRLCGIDKKVNEYTFDELQELSLHQSKERIPSFQSVLDMIAGQVPIIIEFKVENYNTTVCDITAPMLEKYNGSYCIESFNPLVLLWYKKNRPGIIRGQLASNFVKDKEKGNSIMYFILQNLLINFITKPDFISYNHFHRNMLSLVLCKKLFRTPCFAWTIKSQAHLDASRNSFDFFIFDLFIPQESH